MKMRSEQVGWIDIKDKQPENHQAIIIHIGWVYPNFENVKVAWYEKSQHLFYTDSPTMDEIDRGFVPQELVRRWMPIPMFLAEWRE